VTLVKICGLAREADVDAAVAAGADLVGFILAADSPRGVSVERGRELARRAEGRATTVAVFAGVEPRPQGFDLVQVYGIPDDAADAIVGFRGAPRKPLPDGRPVLLDLERGSSPDDRALEAHWKMAAGVRSPVMLAGSLDPDNVGRAVASTKPWAVDTARGVESRPGEKDHDLIRRFVAAAKEAG
jgi:phosphoribosylanthranilate isomerase